MTLSSKSKQSNNLKYGLCILVVILVVAILVALILSAGKESKIVPTQSFTSSLTTIGTTTNVNINPTPQPTPIPTFVENSNFTGQRLNDSAFDLVSNVDSIGSNIQVGYRCVEKQMLSVQSYDVVDARNESSCSENDAIEVWIVDYYDYY
jgi:hypothetical protein